MGESGSGSAPLRVSFKLPRAELDRARANVEGLPAGAPVPADFDRRHLRGEVTIVVNAPFASDPVLDHLGRAGKVSTALPVTVSLAQPVAYVVGQLAGAFVMASHGEGDFTIPLAGGKGALSVACEGETCHLGVPLEAYAGVAAIRSEDAGRALSAACRELAALLGREAWSSRWTVRRFLEREEAIIEKRPPAGRQEEPLPSLLAWRPDAAVEGDATWLDGHAAAAERRGAHIVPYWKAAAGAHPGEVLFEPLRAPGRPDRAGALGLCIFPEGAHRLEVALPRDDGGEAKLRARLRRRSPFSASFEGARLAKIVEAASELPMA